MVELKIGRVTHRIPENEDARHFAVNCYCNPSYESVPTLPEGWHEYDPQTGAERLGVRVTHRRTLE